METEVTIEPPMSEDDFWREMRRALLMMVALIDKRYGFKPAKRLRADLPEPVARNRV